MTLFLASTKRDFGFGDKDDHVVLDGGRVVGRIYFKPSVRCPLLAQSGHAALNKRSTPLGSSFYDGCLDAGLNLVGFRVIAGSLRRPDCRRLPRRSTCRAMSRQNCAWARKYRASRIGVLHSSCRYSRCPGELVATQLHVLRCGAGYIVPASLGRSSKRTIDLG